MTAENIQVEGAPSHELSRSPATQAVGRLAMQSNLLLSHFEHRVELALPEVWLPTDRPDLGETPVWQNGVLPEAKYQAFRHDRISGSFHPSHRAKWTGHELCHGLVGFAWKPSAPRFFHALAARLAEVLPVALWYFLDEAHLRRCPSHQGGGPLYQTFCGACEAAASQGPLAQDPHRDSWLEGGQGYVQRELDAVRQSIVDGRMVSHRLATLDLGSDGLAYAAAHTDRLNSDAFHHYMDCFSSGKRGYHDSLESLIDRIESLTEAIVQSQPAPALSATRWQWAAQDMGWRLLQIGAETEGEAARALDGMVDRLAAQSDEAGLAATLAAYESLSAEWTLPEPADVFAVGYDLPGGYGRSIRQVVEGLQSALPGTLRLLGAQTEATVATFVGQDAPQRSPLGRRFATFLSNTEHGALVDVARFEAAIAHPMPTDLEAVTLAEDVLGADSAPELVRGRVGDVLSMAFDVPAAIENLMRTQQLLEDAGEPCVLAVVSFADGDVGMLPLSEQAAKPLDVPAGTPVALDALDPAEIALLVEHGLLVPAQYSV
jgi:hypothetical protein